MRILFLSDNFPPEVNAPASRTYEHCREWVKAGHEVTVITCAPNFPMGKVYPGYKNKLLNHEIVDGIKVCRVWSYVTSNEGFVKRSLDFISFAISATLYGILSRKADVVIATSPQFFTALAGFAVGFVKRIPFVFELRDIWPESLKAVGVLSHGRLFRLLEAIELFLYRRAKVIVVVTKAFKENLILRGIDGAKIHVILNGADLSRFSIRPRNEELANRLGLHEKFVVGYIGTHGMAHGLDTLLEAAERTKQKPIGKSIQFVFLGEGAAKRALQDKAKALALDNVTFLSSVSRDEVANYWSLLDLSIIHLKNDPLFEKVIPSKLFECMAMGIPILHGVKGESAMMVEKSKAGLCFEPENAEELSNLILQLRAAPQLRKTMIKAGLVVAETYDRTHQASLMLLVIESTQTK